MNITDEMHAAYRAGRHAHRIRDAHWQNETKLGGECCDRAGLEAVAPLIAAQALAGLRDAALRDGDVPLSAWIQMHVQCPTCSGPKRETVGMVCQTCGTDFAPDTP